MPSSTERDIILEHALRNQENLETTLDIGFAFSELRKRIIVGFLDKLKGFVLEKLGDPDKSKWKVNDDSDDSLRNCPLEQYKAFSFGKKSWKNHGVALESQKDGNVIIDVWRKPSVPRFQPEDLLRKELNHSVRQGQGAPSNKYWEWYHYLDDPYRNWNTKETLIKLYNGEAVEKLGQDLVRIIEVAEPIIDAHVQKSSS